MPCCEAEEFDHWCEGYPMVEYEGKEYCIFHAPAECLEKQDVDAFNNEVFKRIDECKERKEGCDLRGAVFLGDIEFSQYGEDNPLPEIDFSSASFSGDASFRDAAFSGDAVFRSAVFGGDADFSSAAFHGNASFRSASISGAAHFFSAAFHGNASFRSASISGASYFRSAAFRGNADFNLAAFSRTTDFRSVVFSGEAHFIKIAFSEDTDFSSASFSEDASFRDAAFSGDAVFVDASFSGDAVFIDASFSGDAVFRDAAFNGYAVFFDASFSGDAYFSVAAFNGYAYFGDAAFSRDVSFIDAAFSGDAYFSGAAFSGDASFIDAAFSGDASFIDAAFSGYAHFDRAAFFNVFFSSTHFEKTPIFFKTTFEAADFNLCTADDMIEFDQSNLCRLSLLNAPLEKMRLIDCKWPKYDGRSVIYDSRIARINGSTPPKYGGQFLIDNILGPRPFVGSSPPPSRLADVFRRLKKIAADARDEPLASDWHYAEKEMQRRAAKKNNLWFYLGLTAYKWASGYGEAPLRAAVCLAILLLIPWLASLLPPDWAWASYLASSFSDPKYCIPQAEVDTTKVVGYWHYLGLKAYQGLVIVQAGLFGFATRNKMRR